MAVSTQELAILAMDAYNRDYGSGVALTAGTIAVGGAVLQADSDILRDNNGARLDQPAGFYASSYSVGNEIVISFRGTDDLLDAWNDFLTVTGSTILIPPQVYLAEQFYEAVKAANPGKTITLTGHSLGGALAGVIGSLHGEKTVLFNNISFEATAAEIYRQAFLNQDTSRADFYSGQAPTPLDRSQVVSYIVPGDVAEETRFLQATPTVQVGSQSRMENLNAVPDLYIPTWAPFGYAAREINLHWQSFLNIKLFAQLQGFDAVWTAVYQPVVGSLYSDKVAEAAGIVTGSAPDNGDYSIMQKNDRLLIASRNRIGVW